MVKRMGQRDIRDKGIHTQSFTLAVLRLSLRRERSLTRNGDVPISSRLQDFCDFWKNTCSASHASRQRSCVKKHAVLHTGSPARSALFVYLVYFVVLIHPGSPFFMFFVVFMVKIPCEIEKG